MSLLEPPQPAQDSKMDSKAGDTAIESHSSLTHSADANALKSSKMLDSKRNVATTSHCDTTFLTLKP